MTKHKNKNRRGIEKTFGMVKGKWKKSTQKIKDEIRKELHSD